MRLNHTVTTGTGKQVILPRELYRGLRLRRGEYLKVEQRGRELIVKPNTMSDQDIQAQIAEGLQDIKEGRTYGPFTSVKAMLRSLHNGRTKNQKMTRQRIKKS